VFGYEVSFLFQLSELLLTRWSLAYAEMYLTLASIVRRFDMELFDTTVEDVTMVHDFFVASPRLDSKGVRIKVTSLN
jgi:hypothetical protein